MDIIERFFTEVDWSKFRNHSFSKIRTLRLWRQGPLCPLQVWTNRENGYIDEALKKGLTQREIDNIIWAADGCDLSLGIDLLKARMINEIKKAHAS